MEVVENEKPFTITTHEMELIQKYRKLEEGSKQVVYNWVSVCVEQEQKEKRVKYKDKNRIYVDFKKK